MVWVHHGADFINVLPGFNVFINLVTHNNSEKMGP